MYNRCYTPTCSLEPLTRRLLNVDSLTYWTHAGQFLFGTALDKGAKMLARQVNSLEKFKEEAASTEAFRDHLQSFHITTNDRLSTAEQQIDFNHPLINTTVSRLHDLSTYVSHSALRLQRFKDRLDQLGIFTTVLLKTLVINLQALETCLFEIDKKYHGIQSLLNDYLSIQVVPPQDLETALNDTAAQLQVRYPSFTLAHHVL